MHCCIPAIAHSPHSATLPMIGISQRYRILPAQSMTMLCLVYNMAQKGFGLGLLPLSSLIHKGAVLGGSRRASSSSMTHGPAIARQDPPESCYTQKSIPQGLV